MVLPYFVLGAWGDQEDPPRISEAAIQIYRCRVFEYLNAHTGYDLLPDSGKVIALDINLPVKQSFQILHEQVAITAKQLRINRIQENSPTLMLLILSLSEGFNLCGLFEEIDKRKEARFTSSQSVSAIISKLEDAVTCSKLTVKKKEGGVLKMEDASEGRKGVLAIDAEIFEVPPFHLVEIKKNNGDTLEYQNLWKQDMKPALKDIVWAWQGERQDRQTEDHERP